MLSQFSGCDVSIYSHVLFTFTFCWTSVKRINTNHFSSQPSARPPQVWVWAFQCECANFVPFFLFFRSFKGKCLKHTNSQGQELKPHYGLAPPFSPGVSAWTSVWRSSLRQRYKCAVAALLAIYSVKGVKKTKEYMAGQQTHDYKWLKRFHFIYQFPITKEEYFKTKTKSIAVRTWYAPIPAMYSTMMSVVFLFLQCVFCFLLCNKMLSHELRGSTFWKK